MRGVHGAQVVPRVVEPHRRHGRHQAWVVRVGDGVKITWHDACLLQTPFRSGVWQLPSRERHRAFPVLAPAEPVLFRGCDGLAVDDQCGGWVMKDGVETKDLHLGSLRQESWWAARYPGLLCSHAVPMRPASIRRQAATTSPTVTSAMERAVKTTCGPSRGAHVRGRGPKIRIDGVPVAVARCATPVSPATSSRAAETSETSSEMLVRPARSYSGGNPAAAAT